MKYLLKFIRKYTKESILAPLFKMLEATFDLLVPIVVARLINVGIVEGDHGVIWSSCGLLVVLALVGLTCSFVAQYFAAKSATGTATALRGALFEKIQALDASDVDTIGTSTLITRMTSDINQVQNGLNLFLRLFLRSPFIVFGAMIMAFTIDTRIALTFVAVIPVLSLIVFGVMRWTAPRYRRIQDRLDTVTAITRENLSGVRVVRAFGREDAENARFTDANGALVTMQEHVGHISALMNPLTYVVVNLGIVAILYLGSRQVDGGVLLSGDIVALVNYMSQILVELVKLANLIVTLSRAMASLSRVEAVLDRGVSMDTSGMETGDAASDSAVRFDHVSLTYASAGEESLADISLNALRGQTVGIIGGTGSGKSSVVNLIPRFYDATAGTVSVLGRDVRVWDRAALRSSIGIVPQKAQLFRGTIRSNMLWGNPDAGDEAIWQALRLAQAEEFVRQLPDLLDHPVEQGGRNFSGGQRQRLTIARALVRRPEILILDDSASALDFATDAALRAALRTLEGGVTVFIVSQRTSSLRHADQILVLEDGKAVGLGTHEQLLEDCPTYREIHESQFRKEDERA